MITPPASNEHPSFWKEAFTWVGSATPRVLPNVVLFGLFAAAIIVADEYLESKYELRISIPITPFEFGGAVLALLMVLRTNAGYDRWWEARKLWGGIVNQSRNLAINAVIYGPKDQRWRENIVRWTAAFCHVARRSLRGEREIPEVAALVGESAALEIAAAVHMPSYVAGRIAQELRSVLDDQPNFGYQFLQIDRERATLIDHIGGCERILKTPLPNVYAIKIRRFIVLFLALIPLALLHKIERDWGIPILTMVIAYPLLSLDAIGESLQNPFDVKRMSHLPLDSICKTIESNVLAVPRMCSEDRSASEAGDQRERV